jgi:hypothetical protein
MVRMICLIFVFGIASLCVASFIHATTAHARKGPAICPCWPGGPNELAMKLGNPKTTDNPFDPCDTNQREEDVVQPAQLLTLSAEVQSLDDEIFADAEITFHNPGSLTPGVELTSCDIYTADAPMDGISVPEAQECMQDILAYCRDYCRYNPNAQCR